MGWCELCVCGCVWSYCVALGWEDTGGSTHPGRRSRWVTSCVERAVGASRCCHVRMSLDWMHDGLRRI